RERSYPIGVTAAPTNVHPHVAAIGPTQVRKCLRERSDGRLRRRIVLFLPHYHADPPHALGLLRPHRQRPRRRTPQTGDERPSFHWITSSAVANSVSGMERPRALAVLRLMTRSIFVICCTGRSAGLSPFRMRPVYRPA